jgi:hypothetical protein
MCPSALWRLRLWQGMLRWIGDSTHHAVGPIENVNVMPFAAARIRQLSKARRHRVTAAITRSKKHFVYPFNRLSKNPAHPGIFPDGLRAVPREC